MMNPCYRINKTRTTTTLYIVLNETEYKTISLWYNSKFNVEQVMITKRTATAEEYVRNCILNKFRMPEEKEMQKISNQIQMFYEETRYEFLNGEVGA